MSLFGVQVEMAKFYLGTTEQFPTSNSVSKVAKHRFPGVKFSDVVREQPPI